MDTGDPDDFPALLGVELQGIVTLPGLAGERAHCHFIGTDDWELAWMVIGIFRTGARITLAVDGLFHVSCVELSSQ
jgi:hypothetical protein